MKRAIFISLLSFILFPILSQNFTFSDSAKVSLLTCSPGEKVYEKFGHTAIRVNDPVTGIDVVFNFGVFDFNTKNFYLKFVKGETDYQLAVYDTKSFLEEYKNRNSIVWEQKLNLTLDETRNLLHSLLKNYEPENRFYRYNFVYDNCSTRPRDKILQSIDEKVEFHLFTDPLTFREMLAEYAGINSWLQFGLDLIFGCDADKIVSRNISMFLPENLMYEFQAAHIISSDGTKRHLISESKTLTSKHEEKLSRPLPIFQPVFVCTFLLIIGIIITIFNKKKSFRLFDSLLYIISGIGGIIVFYLAFFSSHPLVKNNFNLLWLNPLNFILGILLWFHKMKPYVFYYQVLNCLLIFLALLAYAAGFQVFHPASIPLILLLLLRTVRWTATTKKDFSKKKKNNRAYYTNNNGLHQHLREK
jgi:hypothetical protein